MSIAIEVDSLSKKYRLGEYQAAYGTLRETLVHAREAAHAPGAPSCRRRRSGRSGTSRSRFPRGRCSASSGATAPGKSTLLKILTRIATPTDGARRDPRPRRQPARGRDGLQPGADRPREHLPQRRDPRDEAPGDRAALRRHRRVLRGREVHRHAGEAVLERHVRPARVRGRRALRARDPASWTRCSPWATPSSSDAASGAWRSSRNTGGPWCSSPTTLPAVAQLCDRAIWIDGGSLVGDGPSDGDRRALPPPGRRRRHRARRGRRSSARGRPRPDPRDPAVAHDGMPPGVVDVRRRRDRDRVHVLRGGGPPSSRRSR